MRLTSHRRNGLVALFVGLAISTAIYLWSELMNRVPVNIPVSLSTGHIEIPEFKSSADIPYNIEIVFDSSIPVEELDCLIGMNEKSIRPCVDLPSLLNVKWKLLDSDGRKIAEGSSSETVGASYSYHRVARKIGHFDGGTGRRYRLELEILQDATRLSRASPRLEVGPMLNAYEGSLLLAGLAFYAGILCAAIGIVVLLTSTIREKRLGRKLADA